MAFSCVIFSACHIGQTKYLTVRLSIFHAQYHLRCKTKFILSMISTMDDVNVINFQRTTRITID